MLPRYFWQRGLAYIIDYFLLAFLITIIGLGAQKFTDTILIAPQLISYANCDELENSENKFMDDFFPLKMQQTHFKESCKVTKMFIESHTVVKLGVKENKDGKTQISSIDFVVDKNENLNFRIDKNGILSSDTKTLDLSYILNLIFPFVMAFFLVKKQTTFGKKIFNLFVVSNNAQSLNFKTALKRECIKGILLFIVAFHYFYEKFFKTHPSDGELAIEFSTPMLIFAGLAILASLWLVFGSFIKWNGQSYWDRFAGTIVQKTYVQNTEDSKDNNFEKKDTKKAAS